MAAQTDVAPDTSVAEENTSQGDISEALPAASQHVLLVQDADPWGLSSIRDILDAHDINYATLTSASLVAADLTPYKLIISPSHQNATYYSNWNASIAKIEAFVNGGGNLWQSISYAGAAPLIPGGGNQFLRR